MEFSSSLQLSSQNKLGAKVSEGASMITQLQKSIPLLRCYARSLTRDASLADELVEETLVSAWDSRGQFAPEISFRVWMSRILRKRFLDHQKRNKRFAAQTASMSSTPVLITRGNKKSEIDLKELL